MGLPIFGLLLQSTGPAARVSILKWTSRHDILFFKIFQCFHNVNILNINELYILEDDKFYVMCFLP